ncbi:SusC/RagA family TonB-linked outer membrane protein [Labilibacter marinus]|uniref:SusC/RagA family TonB-linked outer membrane protein n=1 Tax=Labilibacter marinus TaxID=1477105 RepID=UPI00082E5E8A|nr:TonB-dependent receptor [Labilibacter marinus]
MKSELFNFQKRMSRVLLISFIALIAFSSVAMAQELRVKGVVTSSEDGLPIPGVSVVVKGTTNGTITDIDGKYVIRANKGEIVVFSFIGMKSQEAEAIGAPLNVKLESETIGLDEVVAIGYGTVKKKELTGAVAQVKSEEISKIVTSDVGNALQGLVAGVNVTAASGQPGESSSILIRGVTSINGSNTPLYVVDGVPMEGDPRLSTNEIETIDILKDAASCAIYGTRGAAGVILITTKQGKAGTMRVSLNANYGIRDIRSGTPLMNSSDQVYADILELKHNFEGINDDELRLKMLRSPYYFQNETDLGSHVFIDNAATQDYNLNMSGGSKDISYNVTVGYYNQEGVVINSGFERFNTRINTVYNHNKWRINASVGGSLEETDRPPGGIITQTIKYHPTNNDLDFNSDEPIYATGDHEANNVNWVFDSFRNTDVTSRNNQFANLNVNYNVMKGLNISARAAVRGVNDYRHSFSPFQEVYDAEGDLTSDPERDSYVRMTATKSRSTTYNIGATYRKSFNKHNMTLYAGQSTEKYTFDSFEASRVGVVNNNVDVLDGAVANPAASSMGNDYVNKLIGYIGRVQYNYKSKYLLSASVRRDGSSKFAAENRWGTFPSASAAWNVSDEPFFSAVSNVVNTFKLRGSYGQVGNQNFTPYSFSAGVINGVDYILGGEQSYGSAQQSYANANVKWETSIQSNYGVDLAFLNNKITLTAEYYTTSKKDMLMPIEVAPSNGSLPTSQMETPKSSVVMLNVGDMTNQGIELALAYKAKTGNVKWDLSGTFSTNDNEVTKINGLGGFTLLNDGGLIAGRRAQSQVTALAEGYEAGAFFIYKTEGVIDTHAKLAEYQKIDATAKMGDLMYADTYKDGVITDADRVYGGSGLPEFEVGFNVKADYKNIDFSMSWYSAIGHEIMNGSKATAYAWNRHADMTSQWSVENPTSPIPAYRGEPNAHKNYHGNTDLWLEDGSYIRLRNVTLGYTLPTSAVSKLKLSKCRFYVTAQNPLTFTNYQGYDPEVGGNVTNRGLDKGNYPVTSLYSVGVNLNF